MWNIINGIIIIPIMCAFTYGLIREFEETVAIAKFEGHSRKNLIGHIICCSAYTLFLLGYIVNGLYTLFGKNSLYITPEFTSMFCAISISVFLLSKYSLVSKG